MNISFSDQITSISVLVTIGMFFIQVYRSKNEKSLSILYNYMPVALSLSTSMKIIINGDVNSEFSNLSMSTVVISNTGRKSIKNTDLLGKFISIKVGQDTLIRDVNIMNNKDTIEENILTWNKSKIDFNFTHLGKGEFIIIDIIYETKSIEKMVLGHETRHGDNLTIHAVSPKIESTSEIIDGTVRVNEYITSEIPRYYFNWFIFLMLLPTPFAMVKATYDFLYIPYAQGAGFDFFNILFPIFIIVFMLMLRFIYVKNIKGIFYIPKLAIKKLRSHYGLPKTII